MEEIDNYIKGKRLELGLIMQHRKIIYLDVNYWITLDKQSNAEDISDKTLLLTITELVESKKCIFPISEITFFELLKQSDKEGLRRIIRLIDTFSEGISMINSKERMNLEVVHFLRSKLGDDLYDLKQLIWTKAAFILGYHNLFMMNSFANQKSFFDFINNASLLEIYNTLWSNSEYEPFEYKDDVDQLGIDREKYKKENNTPQQIFLSELGGYLDEHQKYLDEALLEFYFFLKGKIPSLGELKTVDRSRSLIYNEFKKGTITNGLPIFRIVPELYTNTRQNENRKYDKNDTMDFLHASFALPYCDYFFTENNLHSAIKQRKLDSLYNCIVVSKPKDVLNILVSLIETDNN
jgi:hypothetical protein